MNTILLQPNDVLFFRDGRPMSGASSGHGAGWPLPSVLNHALHAALHRAGFEQSHEHRRGRSGKYGEERDRRFGSLKTVGPFPVRVTSGGKDWCFPRPLDAADSGGAALLPWNFRGTSSLPAPLLYPVGSRRPPAKETFKPWLSTAAYVNYLQGGDLGPGLFSDADLLDTEHAYGIEISPETGTVVEKRFYSAHYLRLKPDWRMGLLGEAVDKDFAHPEHGTDLVRALLTGHGARIIAGGQQRVCTAVLEREPGRALALPQGPEIIGNRVKWVLLTPSIWPKIGDHPGGWLPSWVDHGNGQVLLLDGPGNNAARRRNRPPGKPIGARLVAAVTGKPVPVTGYALPNESESARPEAGGAKSTHLAVPAGSVYYFEAESPEAAKRLAAALNWHGETSGMEIKNRRSTLMGEKGFGMGVCGSWQFFPSDPSPS